MTTLITNIKELLQVREAGVGTSAEAWWIGRARAGERLGNGTRACGADSVIRPLLRRADTEYDSYAQRYRDQNFRQLARR